MFVACQIPIKEVLREIAAKNKLARLLTILYFYNKILFYQTKKHPLLRAKYLIKHLE